MGDDTKTEKVSGYLEKKGKLKVMCSWKKYWFVLEGRLLLYYRSKLEYDLISPCKGSINLGPPCSLKSCPSVPCAFQIETRSTTVTLRSENRAEQNRWMQAIMLALNQHPSPTKLTHFRYSLDSLVPNSESNKETAKVETPLERQNTMPERLKTQYPKRKKQIIQRLQKLGAHSYGGSLGTINKLAPHQRISGDYTENGSHMVDEDAITKADEDNVESRIGEALSSPSSPEKSPDPCLEYIQENDHYATASEIFVDRPKEEEEQDCILENPQYISTGKINQESVEDIQERDKSFMIENNIYERISGESNDSADPERPGNFMVGNDNYSIPIKRSSPSKSPVEETASDRNCIAEKRKSLQRQDATVMSDNAIYSEPKLEEITDQNDNNVTIENVDYISIDDLLDAHEVEYECLDKTVIEDADRSPTIEEDKQVLLDQNPSDTKQKHKSKYTLKNIMRRNSKEDKPDKNDRSLRKSSSFIKKVWKRRGKRIKETEDKEDIYEEIDRGGTVEKKAEGEIQNAVEILNELANILETKKSKLKEKLLQNPPIKVDIHSPQCDGGAETEEKGGGGGGGEEEEESAVSYLVPDEVCPELPKKTNLSKNVSPYHDVPANNQPVIIPKLNKTKQRQQSLDEILDDLNKQESQKEKRSNVKELIEKFDDNDGNKCDVVLRRMQRSESDKTPYRHSDELDKLLDELTKVTTAPVMKPGVTSSLLTPKRTDEEWLKLLPIRKRRLSEPDYDVPRSHRSLLSMSSKDEGEKEITGTRFFGPVIGPCDQKEEGNSSSSSVCSMTPDSLEPLIDNEERNNKIRDPPPSDISYTSHTYPHSHHKNIEEVLLRSTAKELKCHTYNCRKQNSKSDDKIIYAQPKIIRSRKIYDSQAKFLASQDMFIDSLEQYTEKSTAF